MFLHLLPLNDLFDLIERDDDLLLRIQTKIELLTIRNPIIFLTVHICIYACEPNAMINIQVDILLDIHGIFEINQIGFGLISQQCYVNLLLLRNLHNGVRSHDAVTAIIIRVLQIYYAQEDNTVWPAVFQSTFAYAYVIYWFCFFVQCLQLACDCLRWEWPLA